MLLSSSLGLHSLVTSLCISFFLGSAHGFFPTEWQQKKFGHNGVSHIQQTDQVFQTLASKYFPTIKTLTTTMIEARKTISKANAHVDSDQTHSAPHFDGENFRGGQARLTTLKQQVIDFLGKHQAVQARKALGSALHTVQDFYSHTNWVEMGNTAISSELGRGKPIAHAAFGKRTCVACGPRDPISPFYPICRDCHKNVYTDVLTSGYYFNEDSPGKGIDIPAHKCHHGGKLDHPKGAIFGALFGEVLGGINKDSLNCIFSPHYAHHRKAVEFAIDASVQYIEDIKKEISERQLRLLFGVGPTLGFAIDTTGSMEDIISSVRDQSIAIVTRRLGTPDEPSVYIVSPFNDPGLGPFTITSDFDTFKSAISTLDANGGGDCPELSMTGMLKAIDAMNEGASLFVMTDAAPKDAHLVPKVISEAQDKKLNIYIYKFDSRCDDGLLRKRQDSVSNSIYAPVALATGGQYHSIPRDEVGRLSGFLDSISRGDSSFILKVAASASSGEPLSYEVPVDSEMSEFSISLRGTDVKMAIARPGESSFNSSRAGGNFTVLSDGHFFTTKSPDVGVWNVTITGTGNFTLDAAGVSPLHFSSFDFVALAGRSGHTGYFPISGPPAYDHDVAAIGVLDGAFSKAKFELRSPSGNVVVRAAMEPGSGDFGQPPKNSFFGVCRLKPERLVAYVFGRDGAGKIFQRVLPSIITPFKSNTTFTGIYDKEGTNTTGTYGNSTKPYIPGTASIRISHSPKPHFNVSTIPHHAHPTKTGDHTRSKIAFTIKSLPPHSTPTLTRLVTKKPAPTSTLL